MMRWLKNWIGRAKGYSGCLYCGDTWNWKKSHTTSYTKCYGCFPLCEECWQMLGGPSQRMPYYMSLVDKWISQSSTVEEMEKCCVAREQIRHAVWHEEEEIE